MRNRNILLSGLVILSLGVVTMTQAATVVSDPGTTYIIGGLAAAGAGGSTMDGMTVVAEFDGGFSESLIWGDTGAISGGVTGTGWSLNLSGNSFTSNWQLSVGGQTLRRLSLIGSTGLTAFDRTWLDNTVEGTLGSGLGTDFVTGSTLPITATYRNQIAIIGNPAVGDLYERLIIDFGGDGFVGTPTGAPLSFRADTDNVPAGTFYEPSVPGPAAILPFGLGFIAALRKRSKRK